MTDALTPILKALGNGIAKLNLINGLSQVLDFSTIFKGAPSFTAVLVANP